MDSFKDYLIFGLTQPFRNENRLSCIYALDDFITNINKDFSKYIECFIPELIKISNDPSSDKVTKLRILMTFSDALLYCTKQTFNHIDSILEVVNFALEYCCIPCQPTVILKLIYNNY
jgi:hypothetical protein